MVHLTKFSVSFQVSGPSEEIQQSLAFYDRAAREAEILKKPKDLALRVSSSGRRIVVRKYEATPEQMFLFVWGIVGTVVNEKGQLLKSKEMMTVSEAFEEMFTNLVKSGEEIIASWRTKRLQRKKQST